MFRLSQQRLELQRLIDFVTDPEAGAIATFIGTTRNNNEGRKVIALDYEAYPEMAEKELARVGAEATKRWPICRIAILHRLRPAPKPDAPALTAVSSAPPRANPPSRVLSPLFPPPIAKAPSRPADSLSKKSSASFRSGKRKSTRAEKSGSELKPERRSLSADSKRCPRPDTCPPG